MKISPFLFSLLLILPRCSAKKCGFFDKTKERISCALEEIEYRRLSFFGFQPNRIQNSCRSLLDCYSSLKCLNQLSSFQKLKSSHENECDSYLEGNLEEKICNGNLNVVLYGCKLGRTCWNMFGQKNCAERLIKVNCATEDWQRFKEMVIKNYSGSLECDYTDQWDVVKNF
ncbi:unnamed protein product [Caenorhabditis brenneri]